MRKFRKLLPLSFKKNISLLTIPEINDISLNKFNQKNKIYLTLKHHFQDIVCKNHYINFNFLNKTI